MLLSDESSLHQISARATGVRRPSGKKYDDRYAVPVVKQPPSQMI